MTPPRWWWWWRWPWWPRLARLAILILAADYAASLIPHHQRAMIGHSEAAAKPKTMMTMMCERSKCRPGLLISAQCVSHRQTLQACLGCAPMWPGAWQWSQAPQAVRAGSSGCAAFQSRQ